MKKHLLLTVAAAAAISAGANDNGLAGVSATKAVITPTTTVSRISDTDATRLAEGVFERVERPAGHGMALKRIINLRHTNSTINPLALPKRAIRQAERSADGVPLFESCEAYGGTDITWLPENWSRQSDSGVELQPSETWYVCAPHPLSGITVNDGKYYIGIDYSSKYLDESLVTPLFTLGENELLSFEAMYDPIYLFSLDNIDWDKEEYIGDKTVSATLQVRLREEGGEWITLWDAADQFADATYKEIMNASASRAGLLMPHQFSLADYAGKSVQLAFRYVGTDGNSIYLDAIRVGLGELAGVAYSNPFETLYFGISEDMQALGADFALYPVHSPITWSNNSSNWMADYEWTYCATPDGATETSTGYDLTLTYFPDYTSEASARNNLYPAPSITGRLEGFADATYTAPYRSLQAGGRPDIQAQGGLALELGVLPFMPNYHGKTMATVDYDNYRYPTPIFGYSPTTEKYWTEITKNGAEEEDITTNVTAIYNFIYSSPAPLVVRGARIFAFGHMDPSTVLTLDIVALNEDFSMSDEIIASATATGEDLNILDPDYHYYLIPTFKFDTPAVLDDSHPAYIVRLRGFNAETVDYFAPIQGMRPNEDYLCHGFVTKTIVWNGEARDTQYPIAYETNEYGDMYTAFAIVLDAEYPWLKSETDAVELVDGGVSVKLDSFYDGSDLTVTAPAGAEATVTGRYGDCRLNLRHDDTAVIAQGKVTVSGPGVKVELDLTQNAGIESVSTEELNATAAEVYTLTGARVSLSADLPAGLYVVKYSDGSIRKTAIK
ncbi:MAG: hypothetical protein K2K36_03020 [Muribaculaceae bacterium]|nr:hypothetical protein [Muribaculaceae bacterium]